MLHVHVHVCAIANRPRVSDNPYGVVGESNLQITALTSIIREKVKQVEEHQHKLEDSTPSGVSAVIISTRIIYSIMGVRGAAIMLV